MRYLSRILGSKVLDSEGNKLGVLEDLIARTEGKFPEVVGILCRMGRSRNRTLIFFPWDKVLEWKNGDVEVVGEGSEPIPQDRLYLARDLLDKQIVDLDGYKIVRVSDVKLAQSGHELRVVGADVGLTAVMRRLGLAGLARRIKEHSGALWGDRTVSWDLMSPLEPGPSEIRLSLPYREFREIHPSDVADIIEQLDPDQRQKVFAILDNPVAAEVLTQVLPGVRSSMAEALEERRLSVLLEKMEPDEAADILGSLPRKKGEILLSLMGIKESVKVLELLGYPDDSAGGRMTPEFIAVPDHISAQGTIETLRDYAKDTELIYYAYVVDDEGRLKGVLSLRDLLRAPSDQPISGIMKRDLIFVHVDDDQEVVAEEIADHNLLALPVVDDDNLLKGIVTVDDVMDVIKEERAEDMAQLSGAPLVAGQRDASRERISAVTLTFIAGLIGTALMGLFEAEIAVVVSLVCFLPLLIRMGSEVSLWSRVASIWELRGEKMNLPGVLRSAATEIPLSILAAVVLCGLGYLFALLWGFGGYEPLAIGLGLFFSVACAGILGIVMPLITRKLRIKPSCGEEAVARTIIAGSSIVIFLLISLSFIGK